MNSLKRDLLAGELVILKRHLFQPEYQSAAQRIFCVTGGFGLSAKTSGVALLGYYVADGESARQQGTDIDVRATNRLVKFIRLLPLDDKSAVQQMSENLSPQWASAIYQAWQLYFLMDKTDSTSTRARPESIS